MMKYLGVLIPCLALLILVSGGLLACQTNITTPTCSPFANASSGGGGAGSGGEAAEGGAGGQASASAGADCTAGTVRQE